MMRRLGFFVTESSEHNAEYLPYFLKDDEFVERYDIPVDEYVRRSEKNPVQYAETRRKLLAGEEFPDGWCRNAPPVEPVSRGGLVS